MPRTWPPGTLLVNVPEPGEAAWPGEWAVYLLRNPAPGQAETRIEVRRWGADREGAERQAGEIAELLYPGQVRAERVTYCSCEKPARDWVAGKPTCVACGHEPEPSISAPAGPQATHTRHAHGHTALYAARLLAASQPIHRGRTTVTLELEAEVPNLGESMNRLRGEQVALITGDLTTEGIAGACRAAGVRSRQ